GGRLRLAVLGQSPGKHGSVAQVDAYSQIAAPHYGVVVLYNGQAQPRLGLERLYQPAQMAYALRLGQREGAVKERYRAVVQVAHHGRLVDYRAPRQCEGLFCKA